MTRIEGENAWLFLPTGTVNLPHVPSGSGAKYTDGEITFWSKGEEATLEVGEGARQDTMSGEAFETTVTVVLDGKEFRGCGRALH